MQMSATSVTRSFTPAMIGGCILAFVMVLAPLVAIVWVSFFENKIISFPPTGYTLGWYATAGRCRASATASRPA